MPTNQSLNVGLVFDDSLDRPDGVAHYVKTLGAWLSGQGHNVSYLVGETKLDEWAGAQVYSLSKNQTVNFNGNKLSVPLPGAGRKIKKFMANHQFDVLHVMVPYSPFMAGKIINAAPDSAAVVGTFHIFPSGRASVWGSHLLRTALRGSLNRFNQIVSVSQASANFARAAYHIKPSVVPNPVDVSKLKLKSKLVEHKGEIVFLGRLVKRKGAAQLIDAFSYLTKLNPDARLVIAGDGTQRVMLEAKVSKLGLSSKVKFLGYIDEKDKSKVLGQAAIACFPSLYGEAFGIVLIEAMAAGTKVVAGGNNPGYASVLGGRPELLVNPNDSRLFAQQLNELLSDNKKRASIYKWQQEQIKKYDINVVGRQIIDVYQTAIARLEKTSHNNAHESQ